jgi:hypothetical protein
MNARHRVWITAEAATLLCRKELSPKTATDMALLLVDRLEDLQKLCLRTQDHVPVGRRSMTRKRYGL